MGIGVSFATGFDDFFSTLTTNQDGTPQTEEETDDEDESVVGDLMVPDDLVNRLEGLMDQVIEALHYQLLIGAITLGKLIQMA